MVYGYDLKFTSGMGRRGREIIPNPVVRAAPSCVRKARESSLGVRGAQIFNLLPEKLRSTNSKHIDLFKNHLEVFLASIPDQPTMKGCSEQQPFTPAATFLYYDGLTCLELDILKG